MSSNRLVPWQFGPGVTADATRIEQAIAALVALYDDVPPEFVQRRWSPSTLVWGFTPPLAVVPDTRPRFPFLEAINDTAQASATPQGLTTFRNPQRVKSSAVPAIDVVALGPTRNLLTWETTIGVTRPCIVAATSVFAEHQVGRAGNISYINNWVYGAGAVAPAVPGQPTTDFTLQCCVSDGWDLENRRKLRQESLLWRMRSDAFAYSPAGIAGTDGMVPFHPIGNFLGFALTPAPLILVPAGARIVFQFTIPLYSPTNFSTWDVRPDLGNVWSLNGLVFHPTR